MVCVADKWLSRSPGRTYRSCYNSDGKMCCRADVARDASGWLVRMSKKGQQVPTKAGTFGSQEAAVAAADRELAKCGCTGLGGGLGRLKRKCRCRR